MLPRRESFLVGLPISVTLGWSPPLLRITLSCPRSVFRTEILSFEASSRCSITERTGILFLEPNILGELIENWLAAELKEKSSCTLFSFPGLFKDEDLELPIDDSVF
jgi:hypothetical protein